VRILLVSPFDFGWAGGVNEHVVQLDRQFQRMGHQTRILAATSPEVGDTDDGHVIRIGSAVPIPSNGSRARIAVSPLVPLKVRQFLQDEAFDVVHLHEPMTPMLCLAVLLHSRSVNVGTFHAARPVNVMYHYTKAILDMFFEKLDARIAVSEAAREFVDSYFPAEFTIVPNGISLEQYHPGVEPIPGLMDGRRNILFVGRYNEQRKGFRYLVRAMPLVRDQFPDARLVVVGQGDPERSERYLLDHGIDDTIFTGFVSAEMLPRYYASCDVFCAPSTGRESFGLILLEALATGKPVVAAANAGYRAVIRNGIDGVLVEPKDHNALALGIVRVLADAELRQRMRTNALEHVKQFSWPVVAERVLQVYEQAIAGNPARNVRTWPVEIAGRR
jgi:phosphatidyl-myo-inositol alpha-mannosyltransferase